MSENVFRLSVKASSGGELVLEGLGVVFNSVDLDGEYFTSDTNFWLEHSPSRLPVLYEHAADSRIGARVLGFVEKISQTPLGLKMRLVLDNVADIKDELAELVRQGALGLSTGTVGHLMERAGSHITSWPLSEVSLTRYPKEVSTMDLAFAKSAGLDIVEWRMRDIQYAKAIDAAWELVGLDAKDRRRWLLKAELLELQWQVEQDERQQRLRKRAQLIKDLKRLENAA